MIFKVFDAEKSPSSQGYEEGSLDLIIASNVLHATKSLQKTLENTRRLLKPGGYLLLLEITNNGPIRIGSMTGGLPGWWVGVDDGRRYAPTVSPATWNSVLRKSGFSGVDAMTPDRDNLAWPFSILAAQATDERVNFLRRPLLSNSQNTIIEDLVILGTKSIETSRIAEDVADLVGKFCRKITVLESLPTNADFIAPMSTFLNLADLDAPIFKNMTIESMDGLKRLFELSRNILWITQGCRADEPYHMSSVGFGRAISHEMPHMRLQFLDLDNLDDNVSHLITETLLRLHATEEWERDGDLHTKLFWTTEPELVLQKNQLLVPRVLANESQNARLNSWRRSVTKMVALQTSAVKISHTNESFVLQDEALPMSQKFDQKRVNVSYSVLSALKVAPETFMFVNVGTAERTGEVVVGLSEANSSSVICRGDCVLLDVSPNQTHTFLSAIVGELLARYLVAEIPAHSILLVHEPEHSFASALDRRANAKGIQVTYSTTNTETKDPAWITLHPLVSERVIKKKIHRGITHFLDLAVKGNAKDTGYRISMNLPAACRRVDASAMFREQSSVRSDDEQAISTLLTDAVLQAKTNMLQNASSPVPLARVADTTIPKAPTTIIDWTADDVVAVQVYPYDSDCLFSSDKTYLLVGLTGQIGQSLCEWMARNGAGYICLTSRNPNVSDQWLDSFKDTGTTVKLFAM